MSDCGRSPPGNACQETTTTIAAVSSTASSLPTHCALGFDWVSASAIGSFLQEVREQLLALLGEETLRMILHALQRPGLVTHAHDFVLIGPGADLILRRERAGLDDQAVIARRCERVGHACV